MSNVVTTFIGVLSESQSLSARLRVPSGSSDTITGLSFYFTDGSMLESLVGDITDIIYFPIETPLVEDVLSFNLERLQLEYSIGGSQYENYFDADGAVIEFTINSWVDGLYKYVSSATSGSENIWLLHIPVIEDKLVTLSKELLDSQCQCKIDAGLSEKFIKAKAYQELIYNKVINLTTEELTAAQNTVILAEVNDMVKTLTNFLEGTNNICGC
jgi:hypothetical protein